MGVRCSAGFASPDLKLYGAALARQRGSPGSGSTWSGLCCRHRVWAMHKNEPGGRPGYQALSGAPIGRLASAVAYRPSGDAVLMTVLRRFRHHLVALWLVSFLYRVGAIVTVWRWGFRNHSFKLQISFDTRLNSEIS